VTTLAVARPVPPVLVSRADAARLLGMSLNHFKRHVQPHLAVVYCGQLRLYRYRDLEKWADKQACPAGRAA
jgi:hypothetical protein